MQNLAVSEWFLRSCLWFRFIGLTDYCMVNIKRIRVPTKYSFNIPGNSYKFCEMVSPMTAAKISAISFICGPLPGVKKQHTDLTD